MVEAENARSLPVAALSFQQLTGESYLRADIYHGLLASLVVARLRSGAPDIHPRQQEQDRHGGCGESGPPACVDA